MFIALAKVSTAIFRAAAMDAPAVRGLAVWSALSAPPPFRRCSCSFDGSSGASTWPGGRHAVAAGCAALLVHGASAAVGHDGLRLRGRVAGAAIFAIRDGSSPPASVWPGDACSGRLSPEAALILAGSWRGIALGVRAQTGILDGSVAAGRAGRVRPRPPSRAPDDCRGRGRRAGLGRAASRRQRRSRPHISTRSARKPAKTFSGVVMLWTHRTPRVAAAALLNTFIWPWGWWLGVAVCVLASWGPRACVARRRAAAAVLLVAFGPYAIFHLLFQETETVRYALPLVPPVAYLAIARRRVAAQSGCCSSHRAGVADRSWRSRCRHRCYAP